MKLKAETPESLEHILKAEEHLRLAGIKLETGYDFEKKEREWFFED